MLSFRRFMATALVLSASMVAAAPTPDPALLKVIADPARTPAFVARDSARHPAEELSFFGLRRT